MISSAWLCWIVVRAASSVWLCCSAIWIASSSVIFTGPCVGEVACAFAGELPAAIDTAITETAKCNFRIRIEMNTSIDETDVD